VISLLHFCALILFAICALSHSFFFILLVLFLSSFFLVVLFYNEKKKKKQFPVSSVSFSSWFEDCVVASVARKEVCFA
jgi:hypothetical protein